MERGKLNVDFAGKIAEFEMLLNKVIPKKMLYRFLARGKGIEFDSYRNFGSDEDASLIDWKASIRSNNLLARQYVQEKNLNVMFVVDVGENMVFGSQEKLKCEYTAEMVAALSHSIINSGDQIGFILFNNTFAKLSPIRPGKKQLDILLYNLLDPYLYKGTSNIGDNLNSLVELLNPSVSMVILISDFLRVNENQKNDFGMLGNLFETVAIMVRDPLDKTLPDINKEMILESYNGDRLLINPSLVKKTYELGVEKQTAFVRDLFQKSKIDLLELDTRNDFALDLATFLKRRVDRRD